MNTNTVTRRSIYLDTHLADLQTIAHAWRNMEHIARNIEKDVVKADLHKARAETVEAIMRDLTEQPVTVVRR